MLPATLCLAMATAMVAPAIKGNQASARLQRDKYFEMAPWEKNPQIMERFGRPTTLDLRWTVKPFDRGGVTLAAVLVTQDGLPPLTGIEMGEWRRIGSVSAPTEDDIPAAIAIQRELIEAWAYERVRSYGTDERQLKRGLGAPPIRVAWALPPKPFQGDWPKGRLNEVSPRSAVADTSLRCGFAGDNTRSVKQPKGGFRFVPTLEELPP